MKVFLLCLCLVAAPVRADQADTRRLNDLIVKAVQAKDYDKARSLTVTQEQRDYVEQSVVYDRQMAAERKRPKATSCYTAGNRVMCY